MDAPCCDAIKTIPSLTQQQMVELLLLNMQYNQNTWIPVFAGKHHLTPKQIRDIMAQLK